MKSVFVSPFRFYLVFFSISFAFCFLAGRLYYLQVHKSDKYREFALGARKNFISVNARRGDIVDKKGNLLASTRSVVTVGLDLIALMRKKSGIPIWQNSWKFHWKKLYKPQPRKLG